MILRIEQPRVLAADDVPHDQSVSHGIRRALFGLGLRSMLSLGMIPLGRRAAPFHGQLASASRLEHGLIIILPGIEGCSSVNDSIARGLVAGQVPHAVRIIDWRRFKPWNPLQLAMERHNRTQARVVEDMISDYQRDYPGQPVHLIGHSAGAGMALFVLEQLHEGQSVEAVILTAAAVSRQYDVQGQLSHTRRGIWNFYSPLDLPTTGLGTMVFGTMDRRHAISAGSMGFRVELSGNSNANEAGPTVARLHQVRFRPAMMKSWNFGGHFGSTNAVFVRRHIAPILLRR